METILARAFIFLRLGGVAEIALVLSLDWPHYRAEGLPNVLLAGAVVAESVVLMTGVWKHRSVRPSPISADAVFLLACLPLGAALTSPAYAHTWVYFMYPFTIITCYAIGIAYRRLATVVGVTALLSAGYALSGIIIHHEVLWNVAPNALTYFANTSMAWLVARELRRSARAADRSRAEVLDRTADLARNRERARHARLLHDHVLQTLESLAQPRGLTSAEMSRHIAVEAAWLRALVEGMPPSASGDLAARLRDLVAAAASQGISVELNDAQLQASAGHTHIPVSVTEAVAGAVQEALTNVAKHAQADEAFIRVTTAGDRITVSILDRGRGFDPGQTRWRTGLKESITGRVAEVGGTADIDSTPGGGTVVVLSVPADVAELSTSAD